jgi:hypothetical protein
VISTIRCSGTEESLLNISIKIHLRYSKLLFVSLYKWELMASFVEELKL